MTCSKGPDAESDLGGSIKESAFIWYALYQVGYQGARVVCYPLKFTLSYVIMQKHLMLPHSRQRMSSVMDGYLILCFISFYLCEILHIFTCNLHKM